MNAQDLLLTVDQYSSTTDLSIKLGITLVEIENWVKAKRLSGGSWMVIMANPDVIQIAHKHASIQREDETVHRMKRIVDLVHFRSFLIHLYAISIIWIHFKNADDWLEGSDVGNLLLNKEEFTLACKSMCASHANESFDQAQLEKDFELLDVDKSGNLAFLEVIYTPLLSFRFESIGLTHV